MCRSLCENYICIVVYFKLCSLNNWQIVLFVCAIWCYSLLPRKHSLQVYWTLPSAHFCHLRHSLVSLVCVLYVDFHTSHVCFHSIQAHPFMLWFWYYTCVCVCLHMCIYCPAYVKISCKSFTGQGHLAKGLWWIFYVFNSFFFKYLRINK